MENQMDKKQRKAAQWAWYFYDFGNSAYAAVVLLAVYASYFKQGVVGTAQGSALWGLSLTISMQWLQSSPRSWVRWRIIPARRRLSCS